MLLALLPVLPPISWTRLVLTGWTVGPVAALDARTRRSSSEPTRCSALGGGLLARRREGKAPPADTANQGRLLVDGRYDPRTT